MKSSDKIWIPNPNFIKNFQSSISSPIVYLWMYCWCSCAYVFLFVCVLAYWLLIFMSVCSLISIWLHKNGETRKYAQFVCECLGVPRPSRASPRTAPGLKQCTAPACWPARTAEQHEPEAEEAPANSQSASTLLSARARTNLRPSLAFQVEPARSAVRLLVRDVSERVGCGVSCGFHFLAIERIFSPSAARCCTTSETFLLFPTKFPQHGTQAKSR